MGRNRTFDETDVIARCAAAFRSAGYEGTSIDDLVQVTGLHRGSLYKAFGSKRGLFVEALRQIARPEAGSSDHEKSRPETTDLLLVALMELAPRDPEIRRLAFAILDDPQRRLTAQALGERLRQRALETPLPAPPHSPISTSTKEPA